MFRMQYQLDVLSAGVRRGEPGAAEKLRGELRRPLRHIVRQTLRSGDRQSPLARRVHGEADRLRAVEPAFFRLDAEVLVERVIGNLCDLVISTLQSGARTRNLLDTLSVSKEESVLELSCAQ